MPKVIGNGLQALFAGVTTIEVTSISIDSGERPQIDITTSTDVRRNAVPGLRSVPSGSITGVLADGQVTQLEDRLLNCSTTLLTITAKQADCSTAEVLMLQSVHISGFTVEASMDEAVVVTVNFFLDGIGQMIPVTP